MTSQERAELDRAAEELWSSRLLQYAAGWLRERGGAVHVATYDRRLATASAAIGLDLVEIDGLSTASSSDPLRADGRPSSAPTSAARTSGRSGAG